jgi:hypothetical protein
MFDSASDFCAHSKFTQHPLLKYGCARFFIALAWSFCLFLLGALPLQWFATRLPELARTDDGASATIPLVSGSLCCCLLAQFVLRGLAAIAKDVKWLNSPRCNVYAFTNLLSDEKSILPIWLPAMYLAVVLMPLASGLEATSILSEVLSAASAALAGAAYAFSHYAVAPAWLRNSYRWATPHKLPQLRQFVLNLLGVALLAYIQGHLWFA